jgi:hypothetical protein
LREQIEDYITLRVPYSMEGFDFRRRYMGRPQNISITNAPFDLKAMPFKEWAM